MIVSRTEFAKELNITQGRVSQYAKRGMPTTDGGVDHDAAMAWIRSHITPQAGIHSHKGADRAYELLRGQDRDDALVIVESILAPLANEIMQELRSCRSLPGWASAWPPWSAI